MREDLRECEWLTRCFRDSQILMGLTQGSPGSSKQRVNVAVETGPILDGGLSS